MKTEKTQIVKIKREWCNSEEEAKELFLIVEDRGDRALIKPLECDLPMVPTETVKKDMLIFFEGGEIEIN